MQTKLSVFCEKLIEAGWLTALIVAPLFFYVFSSRVFEPDKLTFVRSIAVVMALTWLVKFVETGFHPGEDNEGERFAFLRTPLVLPTLLLVAVYLLTTATSVVPRISFWGSYQRLQGTYTTLSYIVIFFLILTTLRTREQLDRLVTTVVLVSLPIALYGIIQHYGLDPLPWAGDVTGRIASSMGNSIFVAAYLIMTVPLTMGRLVEAMSSLLKDERAVEPFVLTGAYFFVLLVQLIGIFFTQSRGPWLGLMGGVFFFILLLALSRGWTWVSFTAIGGAVAIAVFLVVINLPGSPLAFVRDLPYIGRLGQVFETEGGTGKVRVLIWEGAVNLVTPHEPIVYPDGTSDQWNFLRPLIGYGPEAMYVAYNSFYPPDLAHYEARNASPDRSHNETFDALVITGLIGFLIYLLLFTAIFYYGLRWLGMIQTRRQGYLFVIIWLVGGLLSALGFRLVDGTWRFFGVALPAGMIAAFFIYLVIDAVFVYRRVIERPAPVLFIAVLSAIVAHFIEIHFGIAIASTRTYFWTYAALLVLAGYTARDELDMSVTTALPVPSSLDPDVPSARARRRRRRKTSARRTSRSRGIVSRNWFRPVLSSSFVMGLILVVMVFDYMVRPEMPGRPVIWLFSVAWLVGSLVIVAEGMKYSEEAGNSRGQAFAIYGIASLLPAMSYLVVQASLLRSGGDISRTLPVHYLFVFMGMLTVAASLLVDTKLPARSFRLPVGWLSPVVAAVVAVAIIMSTNVDVVRADVFYKQGNHFDSSRQYDGSIQMYRRALELEPDQDFYELFLGRAYLEKAKSVEDPQERQRWLEESRNALERARALNALNTDHSANLARLNRTWAEISTDPQQRDQHLQQALEYYSQATTLSPANAQLWNEWAVVYSMMQQYDEAITKLEHSLTLDKEYEQTYLILGEIYRNTGQMEKAEVAYREMLDLKPKSVPGLSALAYVYAQQGQLEDAVEMNQRVLAIAPNDLASLRNLAILYEQLGEAEKAIESAEAALAVNPEDQGLQAFLDNLRQRRGQP